MPPHSFCHASTLLPYLNLLPCSNIQPCSSLLPYPLYHQHLPSFSPPSLPSFPPSSLSPSSFLSPPFSAPAISPLWYGNIFSRTHNYILTIKVWRVFSENDLYSKFLNIFLILSLPFLLLPLSSLSYHVLHILSCPTYFNLTFTLTAPLKSPTLYPLALSSGYLSLKNSFISPLKNSSVP